MRQRKKQQVTRAVSDTSRETLQPAYDAAGAPRPAGAGRHRSSST
ncbi:hypothetical protein [Streptomyces sp. NPDC048581]